MSVANADEARRALNLARNYREKGSYTVALKWARKSTSLSASSEATALTESLEKEIAGGATSKEAPSSATKATGAETHPSASGAHQRPGHDSAAASSSTSAAESEAKARSFTPEQTKVVKRVIACKAHEYYSILAGKPACEETLNHPLISCNPLYSGKDLFGGRSTKSLSKGTSLLKLQSSS